MSLSYPVSGGAVNAPTPEAIPVSLAYPGAAVNLTPAVHEMGALHFEGNLIPHAWYKRPELRHDDGKADLVALTILADICYWYRPTVIRDEMTGAIQSVSKKFAADKLQWNHEQRAAHFGLTKRQVQDAIVRLKKAGAVVVEIRDRVQLPSGALLFNQVYIEPVVEKIRELCGYAIPVPVVPVLPPTPIVEPKQETRPQETGDTPPPFKRTPPSVTTDTPPRLDAAPPPFKRSPSTKTTTKISSDNVERLEEQNINSQTEDESTLPDGLPAFIKNAIDLTGDARSLARLEQLYAICCEKHDCANDWQKAHDATAKWMRVTPKESMRSTPGAYFDTTLRRLLEKRNIHIPSAADRAEAPAVRNAIAQSLFGEPSHA